MVPGYAFTQQNGWLLIILPWCEIIHGSLAKTRRKEVLHCNHFLIILFALGAACQVKDGELPRLTPLAQNSSIYSLIVWQGPNTEIALDRFKSYLIAAPELPELSSELCSDSLSVSESLSSPEFDRRLKDPEETQQKLARLQLWSLAAKKPKPPIRFRPLLKANLTRPARVLSYGKDIKVQYDIGRAPTGSVWCLIQIVRWINCAKGMQRQDQDIKYWIVRLYPQDHKISRSPRFLLFVGGRDYTNTINQTAIPSSFKFTSRVTCEWCFMYFSNVQRISKVCGLRLHCTMLMPKLQTSFF